jgi:aryl-alcohol dehydrogenase-like predicted oxidoreductase
VSSLIVRLPVASGLLAGKYTKETVFAPTDHRTFNREGQQFNVGETIAGLPFDKGVELANALKPLVPEGMTFSEMALRWTIDFKAVSVAIPAPATPPRHAQTSEQPN